MDEKTIRPKASDETNRSNSVSESDGTRQNVPDIPDGVRTALNAVLDYLWDDELRHARSVCEECQDVFLAEHIFVHLTNIRAWLEARYLPIEMFFDDLPGPSGPIRQSISGGRRSEKRRALPPEKAIKR